MNVETRYLNRQVLETNEAAVFKATPTTACYTFSALAPAPGMAHTRSRGQAAEVCVGVLEPMNALEGDYTTGSHTPLFTSSVCAFLLCEILFSLLKVVSFQAKALNSGLCTKWNGSRSRAGGGRPARVHTWCTASPSLKLGNA